MEFERLSIPDVVLIRPRVFGDHRGFFLESWEQRKFAAAGIPAQFVQDNHSRSMRWTLRGLHYQITQPQGKLVRVVSGAVYDVVVDLRRSSPTFGRWLGIELTEQNKHILWAPPGLAHGFIVLSESADFLYKCTDYYSQQAERTIRWDDPTLAIDWGLPPGVAPIVSAKDANGTAFEAAECLP